VIIATGTIPKEIRIDGMDKYIGYRIFYEIKDVPAPGKDNRFEIIGSGDAAFDYALNLSRNDCAVDILMRSGGPKCIPLLEDRARKKDNINLVPRIEPKSVREENGALKLECESDGLRMDVTADYVLVACGRAPNLEIMGRWTNADIPGLFLAGDVARGDFRQAGIAVGDGILAAMSAAEFLRGKEGT
jgi:thioredoxin reductase (NADPH)